MPISSEALFCYPATEEEEKRQSTLSSGQLNTPGKKVRLEGGVLP